MERRANDDFPFHTLLRQGRLLKETKYSHGHKHQLKRVQFIARIRKTKIFLETLPYFLLFEFSRDNLDI